MTLELSFLGGAGTVTGSKYLVTTSTRTIMVDCGLFQGLRELRRRNWSPLPVRPRDVDAIVLTHAHLDHSGYLPAFVRDGYAGRIFSTAATRELCEILLPDSARLQEEDASWAKHKRFSRHELPLPLYNEHDARACLDRFSAIAFGRSHYLGGGIAVTFAPAGHILGAAIVTLDTPDGCLVFSGDLGRPDDALMPPPAPAPAADWLVIESTYGDRVHGPADPEEQVGDLVRRVAARGGVVLVPAFAVGRAQTILLHLQRLKRRGAIPDVPIFVNSPMATDATGIFCEHRSEHRLSTDECTATCRAARFVRDVAESRALNERVGPMVIISASGMLSGGRVLHHLKAFAPDPRNAILLVGYQAAGTRGADLQRGARTLRVHGIDLDVRAEVVTIDAMSAHADSDELVAWLRTLERPPRETFVTHGEPVAATALADRIRGELGFVATVPSWEQRVVLDGGTLGRIASPKERSLASDSPGCSDCPR